MAKAATAILGGVAMVAGAASKIETPWGLAAFVTALAFLAGGALYVLRREG